MKMLKKAMADSQDEIDTKEFQILIDHHNYILDLIKDLSENYSAMMLGELILNFLSMCFAIFCWTMDGLPPDMEHTTRYGNTAFNFAVVLGLFCYAGDVLTEQCQGICDVVFYKIKEKPMNKNKKFTCLMIIGRSQRRTALSIGGFWELNMETFYLVMRKCISFLAFMQAIREKGAHHGQDRRSLAF
ncbi:hypothetical protein HHI36_014109 [Cryptolaemus montrouzieri]|uniref:Uncharacterized protein n=1 Tax=Cryptolaemus montrouzieri TaxID=559131 RepID=A0ABD2N2V7_9CUCU